MGTAATPPKAPLSLTVLPRHYHGRRKRIHLLFFTLFVALPFLNLMRFDIPNQRFYFAGQALWISEFSILFFTLMFLLFTIAAASMLYGRVYCSYACPQMIFSEASLALEDKLKRVVNKHCISRSVKTRTLLARGAFYGVVGLASIFLAFVFISYFVEPRDLIRRLASLDLVTAAGLAGAVTTILTFLDFAFLRQRFCTTICPYGYLQGMFADKQTLLVVYRDGQGKDKACIECGKCVRVCHMGIDIRKSPFQIECIHCGECIEACDTVLARLKKPGLIHYTWGEKGEMLGASQTWYQRLGLRDAKRVLVMLVMLFYASSLTVALSLRQTVQVRIAPDRTVLFTRTEAGEIRNAFRLNVANRGATEARIEVRQQGLNKGRVVLDPPLLVKAGAELQTTFFVDAPPDGPAPGVNHFELISTATGGTPVTHKMTFIAPHQKP